MSTAMFPETERFPLSPPIEAGQGGRVRPFGLSIARWDAHARFDRDKVSVDPETQIGRFGDRPLCEVITAGTTCQINSDGKDVIALDYPVDDK